MSAMADLRLPGRRPGDTDMHRRQRTKNRVMLVMLLAMCAVFFALTVVRMGGQG
jgi:hypothetical protein